MDLPDPAAVNCLPQPQHLPIQIGRFAYRGFWNTPGVCGLEILPGSQNRIVVITTELKENTGTSITNCVESLATQVCRQFRLPPARMVWIEHYGYADPGQLRGFDIVTFGQMIGSTPTPAAYRASCTLGIRGNQTADAHFRWPHWRPMHDQDWIDLGLPPRPAVQHSSSMRSPSASSK
jgi:hypothetical protein